MELVLQPAGFRCNENVRVQGRSGAHGEQYSALELEEPRATARCQTTAKLLGWTCSPTAFRAT